MRILLIEDDSEVAATLVRALTAAGHTASWSETGSHGLTEAAVGVFGLVVLDLNLPQLSGLEVARQLSRMSRSSFVVVSGYLDVATAVELMKIGAADVIEKPCRPDALVRAIERIAGRQQEQAVRPLRAPVSTGQTAPSAESGGQQSVAWRLASLMALGCEARGDVKTISLWARHAGVSYSGLTELCRLAGVKPRHARDFVRVLRCVIHARLERCQLDHLLAIADRRTLKRLLNTAGLTPRLEWKALTVATFLDRQRFIPSDNPALAILRRLLGVRT